MIAVGIAVADKQVNHDSTCPAIAAIRSQDAQEPFGAAHSSGIGNVEIAPEDNMLAKYTVAAAAALFRPAALSLAAAPPASCQTYPDHPITMIVPLAPGGSTDTLGRIMAKAMSATLGQTVVGENVGGAAGTIGVTRAERATPDGYTVLWGMWGTNVANGAIYNLDFDMLKDLEPVALVATQLFLIDTHKTIAE